MAEKTISTRIINKNATSSEWSTSTLVLKKGEIALAQITSAEGGNYSVPTYAMKIGDGTHTFSQLNWLVAPASDVYDWAKKASLEYSDLPIEEINNNIATAINALESGDTEVAKQFVTTVGVLNGKLVVSRRALTADDIPTLAISKISGLQTALNDKVSSSNYNSDISDINKSMSGLDGRVSTVEGKLDNVTNVMDFVGAFPTAPTTAQKGDVYVNTTDGKEYVYDGTKWVELGDETRLAQLETAVEELSSNQLSAGTSIEIDDSHRINLKYDTNLFSTSSGYLTFASDNTILSGNYLQDSSSIAIYSKSTNNNDTLNLEANEIDITSMYSAGNAGKARISVATDGLILNDNNYGLQTLYSPTDGSGGGLLLGRYDSVTDAITSNTLSPWLLIDDNGIQANVTPTDSNHLITLGFADERYLKSTDTYILNCGGAS